MSLSKGSAQILTDIIRQNTRKSRSQSIEWLKGIYLSICLFIHSLNKYLLKVYAHTHSYTHTHIYNVIGDTIIFVIKMVSVALFHSNCHIFIQSYETHDWLFRKNKVEDAIVIVQSILLRHSGDISFWSSY